MNEFNDLKEFNFRNRRKYINKKKSVQQDNQIYNRENIIKHTMMSTMVRSKWFKEKNSLQFERVNKLNVYKNSDSTIKFNTEKK